MVVFYRTHVRITSLWPHPLEEIFVDLHDVHGALDLNLGSMKSLSRVAERTVLGGAEQPAGLVQDRFVDHLALEGEHPSGAPRRLQ